MSAHEHILVYNMRPTKTPALWRFSVGTRMAWGYGLQDSHGWLYHADTDLVTPPSFWCGGPRRSPLITYHDSRVMPLIHKKARALAAEGGTA